MEINLYGIIFWKSVESSRYFFEIIPRRGEWYSLSWNFHHSSALRPCGDLCNLNKDKTTNPSSGSSLYCTKHKENRSKKSIAGKVQIITTRTKYKKKKKHSLLLTKQWKSQEPWPWRPPLITPLSLATLSSHLTTIHQRNRKVPHFSHAIGSTNKEEPEPNKYVTDHNSNSITSIMFVRSPYPVGPKAFHPSFDDD